MKPNLGNLNLPVVKVKYFCCKLSDVEKIFGADVQKLTINAISMATKEVIYRQRQGIGFLYIIHVKRILFNQMIKERTSIMTGADEVSFSPK